MGNDGRLPILEVKKMNWWRTTLDTERIRWEAIARDLFEINKSRREAVQTRGRIYVSVPGYIWKLRRNNVSQLTSRFFGLSN